MHLYAATLETVWCGRVVPYDTSTFGAQIRTYRFLPPAIVQDHRTNAKHRNPQKTLDHAEGLTELMEENLLLAVCGLS